MSDEHPAFELIRREGSSRAMVTCEHATQRVPDGYRWPEGDAWLRDTHWAYDIGARDLALAASEALGATLVASRFSRLFIDPNRPEDSPTLFRVEAEGRSVQLNTALLDADERARRVQGLLRPYHAALDAEIARSPAEVLVSMHTFTPVYEGQPRSLEIGVLFTESDDLAARVADALGAEFDVALNEPYSGHDGLMYAVDRHARAHGRQAIELEVRQDLAVRGDVQRRVAETLARLLVG